jgi:hypothetical protein
MILAIAEDNLDKVVAFVRESLSHGGDVGVGEALASTLEYVTARHAEDGFGAIALLVWAEALRNPTLATRLRQAIDAGAAALADTARARPVAGVQLAPDVLANTLLCVCFPATSSSWRSGEPTRSSPSPTPYARSFRSTVPLARERVGAAHR